MINKSIVLGKNELAELLGRSPRAIEAMIRRRQIPAPCRIGGRLVWHRDQVDSWISNIFGITKEDTRDDIADVSLSSRRRGRGRPRN